VEAAKAAAFEKLKAEAETKCNICMGTVKAGLDIIRCSCGREYHAMCGERFGKCPGCGTSFIEGEVKSDIEDLEVSKKPMEVPKAADPAPEPEASPPEELSGKPPEQPEQPTHDAEEPAPEQQAQPAEPPQQQPEQAPPPKKKKGFFSKK
jgi:type IV secretory pathway VirB10-like protein